MNDFLRRNKVYAIFMAIIIFSVFARMLIPLEGGMWWDEAVYITLSNNIREGFYSLDPQERIETFRPPLFPFILSVFNGNILLMRFFVFLTSIMSIISVYLLGKAFYNRETGIISALLLSTLFSFIFFSTKILSEALYIALASISLVFFIKWHRNRKPVFIFLSGILISLAFLTRYLGVVYLGLMFLLIIKLSIKNKTINLQNLIIFLASVLITLSPWFLLNMHYYNSPIGGFTENSIIYYTSIPQDIFQIFDLVLVGLWPLFFLIPASYLLALRRIPIDMKTKIMLSFTFLILIMFASMPHKEYRYLLSFSPIILILMGDFIRRFLKSKNAKILTLVVILVASSISLYYGIEKSMEDRHSGEVLLSASKRLSEITAPGEAILTQSYIYTYVNGRPGVTYCNDYRDVYEYCTRDLMLYGKFNDMITFEILEKYKIRYVLSYKLEPSNPQQAIDFFENETLFRRVANFTEYGYPDAVVIYEYIGG